MTEVSFMVYLFIIRVLAWCLFVRFTESNEGCSRPPSLGNGYISPNKTFFHIYERVYYRCSRRHYLFGNSERTCLLNGQWNGSTPYCAKATKNVRLVNGEDFFVTLLDGLKRTCKTVPDTEFVKPMYVEVNGVHSTAVVEIFPELYYRTFRQEVAYFNNSFGVRYDENSPDYVNCLPRTLPGMSVYICDFHTPLVKPLLRIRWLTDANLQRSANCSVNLQYGCVHVCEVSIFVDTENNSVECWPPQIDKAHWRKSNGSSYPVGTVLNVECKDSYESFNMTKSIVCQSDGLWSSFKCTKKSERDSSTVLIYALSAGITLFVVFTFAAIIFIVMKKRKVKDLELEEQTENCAGEENMYDQVNERSTGWISHIGDTQPQRKHSSENKLEPIYVDELLPISSSKPLPDEEDGYLVPIMMKRKKELEIQNPDINTYCDITAVSPDMQLSIENTQPIYANL